MKSEEFFVDIPCPKFRVAQAVSVNFLHLCKVQTFQPWRD